MKTLTDDEQTLLEGLIDYWADHADRCDNIANRRMAEWQKAQDLARVELLKKLRGIATMAGDVVEGYQLVSSQDAEASRERDLARTCLARIASAVGIQAEAPEGISVSESWRLLMDQIEAHFNIRPRAKEEPRHED
jgi:hypothetical protein